MHEVTRCLEENLPVEVNFTATVLKPLHAQWTLESLAFAATQKQWMENAWRGTGLLSILDGTFVPNPSLSSMYVPPPVATAEEAANCEPPSEEEYFYASSSEEGEVSEPEDAGQLELYEEVFSEEEQALIDEDGCAETKHQTEPEEKQDEKLFACNSITTSQARPPTATIVEKKCT